MKMVIPLLKLHIIIANILKITFLKHPIYCKQYVQILLPSNKQSLNHPNLHKLMKVDINMEFD